MESVSTWLRRVRESIEWKKARREQDHPKTEASHRGVRGKQLRNSKKDTMRGQMKETKANIKRRITVSPTNNIRIESIKIDIDNFECGQ